MPEQQHQEMTLVDFYVGLPCLLASFQRKRGTIDEQHTDTDSNGSAVQFI